MDIKLFQQKLNDICAIAEENNKQLSQQRSVIISMNRI